MADHDEQQLILTMKYYALGQFTRYIRPGYTIISGDEHSLAAYDAEGHRLIVVMTNVTGKDRKVDVDLSAFSQTGSNVSVIRTSGDMSSGEKCRSFHQLRHTVQVSRRADSQFSNNLYCAGCVLILKQVIFCAVDDAILPTNFVFCIMTNYVNML